MADAPRDNNRVTTLLGTSEVDNRTPVNIWADPVSHALLVEATFTPSGTQDVNLTQVGGVAVALGQTTMSASIPIAIASNQTAIPVSQSGTWNINNISGTVSLPTGAATLAEQQTQTASLSVLDDWDESDRAKVNIIVGQAGVAAGVGASGATTQRVVVANDAGKTLVSTGGSASSSGNNTLVSAGTNRLKVYAFSLSTVSTTAVTCIFQSGAGGTELWRVLLQAPSSVSTGANLVVQPPAWLFATASATLLNLNLSSAQTVHWSVSYFDEV